MGELKQSRIDLLLVKEEIVEYIGGMLYKFTSFSDHAAINFNISLKMERRGGGVWCLNNSLMNDEQYKSKVKDCIESEKYNPLFIEDTGLLWEGVKKKIRKLSIRYAKVKHFRRKCVEKELQDKLAEEIEKAENNPNYNIQNYLSIQEELRHYEKEKGAYNKE